MKNKSKTIITYNNDNATKEVINEENGTITYIILNLDKFIRKNKSLMTNGGYDILTEFYDTVDKNPKFDFAFKVNNYLCPIVSTVKVQDCDRFDRHIGERIAWAKLMRKVYIRLGKMNKLNYKYYESKIRAVTNYSNTCSKCAVDWLNSEEAIDIVYNGVKL